MAHKRLENCAQKNFVELGLVIRLHLFFGGVRSVTTAINVVEEEQEGLQEIEGE